MKSLIFVLLLLGLSPALAGPGDDPIFPWPTSIERRDLNADDIAGEWIGTTDMDGRVYFVTFNLEKDTLYRINVSVELAEQDDVRHGLGYWGGNVFWGHLALDGERYTQMLIYRQEGLIKMRIEKYREGYFDLKLERAPWDLR